MFIAVEIEEGIRKKLVDAQHRLMKVGANIKWVEPENIHLTVKFLGNVDPQLTVKICEVIERATKGFAPFAVEVVGLGAFPPKGAPRVVWAGVTDETSRLLKIHDALNSGLVPLGIPYEKRNFHAHITLGRVRSPKKADLIREELRLLSEERFGSIVVEALTLFASELTERGPVYTPLAVVSLQD